VRTKVKGVLRVGTTLDNPPFSTVNDKLQPDGFDIALITELARRLGLGVEINDFTFDHLGPAVVKNQVDAAIAAISITPDRAGQVDFTNVYYVGQDGVLAAPDSAINRVGSLNDLAQLRVGVQKGSVYERWMNENAVQTGKMPAERLIPVVSPDSGLDALADGQIDALLLDRQPARTFAQQGKAKLVGEQLYPQVYGIAVSKGSSLLPELNRVLAEAQADGTVKRLVEEYLDVRPEAVLPATSVPFGDASGTPRAAPTP
jgi:polar amino acid transport system substrate-binding protein